MKLISARPIFVSTITIASFATLAGAQTSLVNLQPETRQANLSSDGRYVAFTQWDGVNPVQVYLKDLQTQSVTLISRDGLGNAGTANSTNPKVTTANGNVYVTFSSLSSLVGNDQNGVRDVYLATLTTLGSTMELVSANSGGAPGNATSDSGEACAANGRVLVAFRSDATNFGAATGGFSQSYYRDMTPSQSSSPVLVSRSTSGSGGNGDSGFSQVSISGNGSVIAFASSASNLISKDTNGSNDIFTYNVASGAINLVTKTSAGKPLSSGSWTPKLNGDGTKVAFVTKALIASNDTNTLADVYVANVTNPSSVTMTLVSVNAARKPVAGNWDSGWLDPAGTTHALNYGDPGWSLSISASGRYVAFQSLATDLVAVDGNGKMDVFVRDTVGNTTVMASVDPAGGASNNDSYAPTLNADGSKVAFISFATNLVSSPTTAGYFNAFVR